MNRPERLNALTYGLVEDLHTALDFVDSQHEIRALIIGSRSRFLRGLDLTGSANSGTEDFGEQQQGMAVQQHIAELVHHISDTRQPIIAAINGAAAGGDLPLHALAILDTAVLSKFGTAFVPGNFRMRHWSQLMLPRLIGASRELMLTGRVIDSDEANRIGLVSNVTADEDLASTCLAVAREIREIALSASG